MNLVLYNDFSHLGKLENVSYCLNENQVQLLEIKDLQGRYVLITIPDGIFEWFVDILDENKNKIHSDWTEHYDNPIETLRTERQTDIEQFVNDILIGKVRFGGSSILDEFYKDK